MVLFCASRGDYAVSLMMRLRPNSRGAACKVLPAAASVTDLGRIDVLQSEVELAGSEEGLRRLRLRQQDLFHDKKNRVDRYDVRGPHHEPKVCSRFSRSSRPQVGFPPISVSPPFFSLAITVRALKPVG